MKLENKAVFITGAAQGFGKGVAEAVLKRGAKVCIADILADQGEATAAEMKNEFGQEKVLFVKCDVSDSASFESAFQSAVARFGHVDVMCNNAGILNESNWETMITINYTSVVRGTMLAINHMRKDKGGQGGVIINTASMAGLRLNPWIPVYSGTKSAVLHFTSICACVPEIRDNGVRFASVCPVAVKTALLDCPEEAMYNRDHYMNTVEYCTLQQVVEAFLMAIDDDDSNGTLICVTEKNGTYRAKQAIQPIETAPATTT